MGQKTLKVSVVIPAYNEEKYIKTCLDSLMKQKVLADEIIIVDNNSTDNTVQIAEKYPVRIVHEKKQGMIPARNRGFDEAKYDIIARTDADTILPTNWIKKIKTAFEKNDIIALSGPVQYYELPDVITETYRVSANTLFKSYIRIVARVLHHYWLIGPNMALKKSAWEQIKTEVCHEEKVVHEDIDLSIHLAPHGEIKYDTKLLIKTSFRRWKKLDAYPEYLYRTLTSIRKHKHVSVGETGVRAIKSFLTKALILDESSKR